MTIIYNPTHKCN